MSIEVAQRVRRRVDETALQASRRTCWTRCRSTRSRSCRSSLVDEDAMTELHEQWMGEPGPTDVLSFPMDELRPAVPATPTSPADPALLGDVVLCPSSRRSRPSRRGTAPRTSCTCCARTASCTCSATTTPSPKREGDVRPAGASCCASWREARAAARPHDRCAMAGDRRRRSRWWSVAGSVRECRDRALPDLPGPGRGARARGRRGTRQLARSSPTRRATSISCCCCG